MLRFACAWIKFRAAGLFGQALSQIVEISTTAIENNITKLKEKGILKRIGPDKADIGKLIRKIENLIFESKLREKFDEKFGEKFSKKFEH